MTKIDELLKETEGMLEESARLIERCQQLIMERKDEEAGTPTGEEASHNSVGS